MKACFSNDLRTCPLDSIVVTLLCLTLLRQADRQKYLSPITNIYAWHHSKGFFHVGVFCMDSFTILPKIFAVGVLPSISLIFFSALFPVFSLGSCMPGKRIMFVFIACIFLLVWRGFAARFIGYVIMERYRKRRRSVRHIESFQCCRGWVAGAPGSFISIAKRQVVRLRAVRVLQTALRFWNPPQ